jgi:hypothetical protein
MNADGLQATAVYLEPDTVLALRQMAAELIRDALVVYTSGARRSTKNFLRSVAEKGRWRR